MTRKFTQARKNAFLAALRASGNQTLSAERAKVSRSWVQLHRTAEPEFDAACREAIGQAAMGQARALRQAQDERGSVAADSVTSPPARWRFMDGAELVVRGTGGSARANGDSVVPPERARPQIARARVRQWSPRAEERFLEALAATCNVKAACAEAGLSAASAYNHRQRWPAFARRWDEAVKLGYTLIECALIEAAGNFFSGDEPVAPGPAGVVREMTTAQAIHLLHMHKHRVHRAGKRPGLRPREPDIEEVRASILRKIAAIERHQALSGAAGDG
ncbi:MAG: hypothetical protein QM676_01945 [Novosphingobium sp.]